MADPAKLDTDVMGTDEFETHFENAFATVDKKQDDPPEKTAEEIAAEEAAAAAAAAEAATQDAAVTKTPEEIAAEEAAAQGAPPAKTAEEIAAEAAAGAKKEADAEAKRVAATAKAEEKRAAKEAAEAKKAEDAAKALELTDDEKKYIDEVAKDFPEVKKALEVQERLLTTRFEQVLDKKLSELRTEMDPLRTAVAAVAATASTAYEAAILKVHADALDLLPQAEEWIAKQPAFLQGEYNRVLDAGTVAQVVEFFDHFKKAAGITGDTSAADAEAARVAAEKAKADAAKAKKLASQEGVRSRSDVRKDTEPLGFEEAFSRA